MATKITHLRDKDRLSYSIKVETDKETFEVPVVDVRDGVNHRKAVNKIIKAQNNSKFLKPSFSLTGKSYQ